MPTRVKIKSTPSFGFPQFWLVYFFLSIGFIGSIGAYGLSTPFFLLGRIFKPAEQLASRILCFSIQLLMNIQPWFSGDIELNLPLPQKSQGLLLVSNHRSHLDSFILLSKIPGIRIFAKKSLFYIPFLGMMMWLSRQIPAQRGEFASFLKAMEIVRKRLRQGETVHVFPEMKRCPPGHCGTQDFSAFPFLIAIQEKITIVPIVFCETDQVWPKGKYGLQYRISVKVRSLAPIQPEKFTSAEALKNEVKRLIDRELNKELS